MSRFKFQKMSKRLLILLLLATGIGCQNELPQSEDKRIDEVKVNDPNSAATIIRNPVTLNGPVDTVNVAKISFKEVKYDFGEIKEGTVIKKSFEFTNVGKVPLLITDARSTCGCTVPKWPEKPIAPGNSGKIDVVFNSTNKVGHQEKPVTITANTYPSSTEVYIEGEVLPKE